jgi:hypothetical protein
MKAVLLDAPGPPSSLRIGETSAPAPSPDEVLVRVHAASTASKVISFDEIPKNLTTLAEGHVRGKIVARI